MKISIFKVLFIFLSVFIFLFFFPKDSFAQCWQEYQCIPGCDGKVQVRTCCVVCVATATGGRSCFTVCSGWSTYMDCHPWRKCDGQTTCYCSGECLETPENPRYYDNPYFANDPSWDRGNSNLFLPVKLDWDDVPGWGEYGGPQSYLVRINNTARGTVSSPVNNSECNAQQVFGSCVLKSNFTHNWGAKACCTTDGQNCGGESNWNFSTNLAPEPALPLDPDWQGENGAENVSIPASVDWCDVNGAQSYYLRFYREHQFITPWMIPKENNVLPSSFSDEFTGFFTKDTTYQWEVATCLKDKGEDCKDFSQYWTFTTAGTLLPPEIVAPKNEVVNLNNFLSWRAVSRANSYYYEIKKEGETNPVATSTTPALEVPFTGFWHFLTFDTPYNWHVKSCWDFKGEECEGNWSEEAKFKTTGAPPNNLREGPSDEEGKIIIPTKLEWDKVPGAASYYYEISTLPNFSGISATGTVMTSGTPHLYVDYPYLKTGTQYWWQVKTCADNESEICGQATQKRFTTFTLSLPQNPSPENNGNLLTSEKILSWEAALGARFYQYTIDYDANNPPPEEKIENCRNLAGQKVIEPTIVSSTSTDILDLKCLGNYTWWLKSCLDKKCQESSNLAGPWKFNLIQLEGAAERGIIPCGRDYDDPATPWSERESCQFKHLFLLLKNILDFLLWRLGLIILVFLALATGIIYYFSMGAPTTMVRVKSILKSAGIGYGIILLAWIILNWILIILGFQVEIFGRWWQISF